MTPKNRFYNVFMSNIYDIWLNHFSQLGVIDELKTCHHAVTEDDVFHNGETMKVVNLSPWHHEGVWDHIHMVLEEAESLSDDTIVHVLALLHDVAKCFSRKYIPEKNKVRMTGHELGSALMSVNFLKKHYPDKALMMLKVVTLHIMGLRGDNIYEYETDEEVLHYLKLLNTADSLGRIAEDTKDRAGALRRCEEAFAKWIPQEQTVLENNSEKTYTLLLGIPGSGKSTFLKDYEGEVFSHDATLERIAEEKFGIVNNYNEAFKAVQESKTNWVVQTVDASLRALKEHDNVCLDATNLTKKKRVSIAKRARKAGAHVEFVMFWRDWFDCWDCRNSGDKSIPLGVFKGMIESFSYPSNKEYDSIRHIII